MPIPIAQAASALTGSTRELRRTKKGFGIDISVIGDKALERKLSSLPASLQKKAARKALRAGAKDLKNEIKQRLPRDTGRLAKALKVRSIPRSRSQIGAQVVLGENLEGEYASFVELGTDRLDEGRFIRDSVQERRRSLLEKIGRIMGDELERIAREP